VVITIIMKENIRKTDVVNVSSEVPLISIVLVCLNAGKSIERTLQSIFTLDYPKFELIVIDGISDDGTIDILKDYSEKIDALIIEKDHGIYDAMNKGVKIANGDFIYFIGGDDVIVNSWLNLVGRMKAGNTIYYGNSYFPVSKKKYDGEFSTLKLLFRNICHQSIFYPRSVFDKYKFSGKYPLLADYHLNLILKRDSGFTFRYIDILTAIFSENGISTCEADNEFQNDRRMLIKQNYSWFFYLLFLSGMALKRLR
jgi:glycosyltransferase involved in cell wall biosynthesis